MSQDFSIRLIRENENLKRDLAKSQATTQHHQITITQLNSSHSRVNFLQDQVSTLTFYYTQEAHAHRATKSQLQNTSQIVQSISLKIVRIICTGTPLLRRFLLGRISN